MRTFWIIALILFLLGDFYIIAIDKYITWPNVVGIAAIGFALGLYVGDRNKN